MYRGSKAPDQNCQHGLASWRTRHRFPCPLRRGERLASTFVPIGVRPREWQWKFEDRTPSTAPSLAGWDTSDPRVRNIMRAIVIVTGGVCVLLSSLAVVGSSLSAPAADLPSYFKEIVGTETASPAEIGTRKISCSSTRPCSSFTVGPGRCSKRISWPPIRSSSDCSPGPAGDSILYRPGMASIDAPPVPIAYQLLSPSATARWR